ncbi:hypothetical protein B0T14DRAFT_184628 [Immersiella caudata]|uniref:Uncharacterized protein n=1 Tax=Immersiella caudata TaxID=314043 RepID=A0AA40C433_9PEZI|nr:hypothetical protein B0T14DRAFT_184628 [Immersiella caudata]
MDCDFWLHPDTVGGILLRQHGDFLPPLFSARQFRKFCLGGWRQLYYLGLFSLSGRWIALLSLRWWHHVFLRLGGSGITKSWRRAESTGCGGGDGARPGCLHRNHHSLGTAPIYNTPPCQVVRSGAVPISAGATATRLEIAAPGTQPLPRICLLVPPVLSVLSHILDLGFFCLVVVLPAGGQTEHRGFLFTHVLIKITRECKTVFLFT